MNTTLAVVVSAIVILITALVVITIFANGIGNVATLSDGKSLCLTVGTTACASTNTLPPSWIVNVAGARTDCRGGTGMLPSGCTCTNYQMVGCT